MLIGLQSNNLLFIVVGYISSASMSAWTRTSHHLIAFTGDLDIYDVRIALLCDDGPSTLPYGSSMKSHSYGDEDVLVWKMAKPYHSSN
jgi:hypothetical protein